MDIFRTKTFVYLMVATVMLAGCINSNNKRLLTATCNSSGTTTSVDETHLLATNGDCATSCNNNQCYDPTTFICITPDQGFIANGDGGQCQQTFCSDINKCFGTNFICIDANSSNISEGNGGACQLTSCSNINKCYDRASFICINPGPNKISDGDGSVCKTDRCTNLNQCYALTNYSCRDANTGYIADGDGSVCKDKCSNNFKCYHRTTKICQNPIEFNASDGDGTECRTTCTNKRNCINSSNWICQQPTDHYISDSDGTVCKNNVCTIKNRCYDTVDFWCRDPTFGHISDNDGSICKPERCTVGNKCFGANYVCRNGFSSFVVNGNGSQCQTYCLDKAQCYHPNTFICQYPNSNVLLSNNEGGVCTAKCFFNNQCYDFSNNYCRIPTQGKLLNIGNGACTNTCQIAGQCYDPVTFICKDPNSSSISNNDGLACTSVCNNSGKCYDSSYICRTPSLTQISNNDGTDCKSKCNDNLKCIDPDTFICRIPASGYISIRDGGLCQRQCAGDNDCYDPITFICQTPVNGNVSNRNKKVCTNTCNNKNECYDETFICRTPNSGNLSNQDGGVCTSKCSNTNYCFNQSNFVCQPGNSNNISNMDGNVCTSNCNDINKCYDPSLYQCVLPSPEKLSNKDGGICTKKCLQSNFCYNPTSFYCQAPSNSLVSNNDSDVCTSSCNNKSKCFDSTTFVCINTAEGRVSDQLGGVCTAKCKNLGTCYNSNYQCQAPALGFISHNDGSACTLRCRNSNMCYTSQSYTCQTPTSGFVSNQDGDLCTPVCNNLSNCYDKESYICSPPMFYRISNRDGKLCTSSCINKNECYSTDMICHAPGAGAYSFSGQSCLSQCPINYCLNTDFYCIKTSKSSIRGEDGTCISSCNLNQCRNDYDFTCIDLSEGIQKLPDGSCQMCPNENCYDSNFVCQVPSTANFFYQGGSNCVNICAESTCFTSQYQCILPNSNNLLPTDNSLKCTSSCLANECYDDYYRCRSPSKGHLLYRKSLKCLSICPPNSCLFGFNCVEPSIKNVILSSDGTCSSACPVDTCLDISNYTCTKPSSDNKLIFGTSITVMNECSKRESCPEGSCINSNFRCIKPDFYNYLLDGIIGGNCINSCPDKTCLQGVKCIAVTDNLIRSVTGICTVPNQPTPLLFQNETITELKSIVNNLKTAKQNELPQEVRSSVTQKQSQAQASLNSNLLSQLNLFSQQNLNTTNSPKVMSLQETTYKPQPGADFLKLSDLSDFNIPSDSPCLPNIVNNVSPTCKNNGACSGLGSVAFCTCRTGYRGPLCAEKSANVDLYKQQLSSMITKISSTSKLRNLQTFTVNDDTFELYYSVVSASAEFLDDLQFANANLLPYFSNLNSNFNNVDISIYLKTNYVRTFEIMSNLFKIYNSIIALKKKDKLVSYINSLTSTSILDVPLDFVFYIDNSNEKITYSQLTDISKIFDMLHQTTNYKAYLTDSGKTVPTNSVIYYTVDSRSTLNKSYVQLDGSDVKLLQAFYKVAQELISKLTNYLATTSSTSENINITILTNNFEVYIKDFNRRLVNDQNDIMNSLNYDLALEIQNYMDLNQMHSNNRPFFYLPKDNTTFSKFVNETSKISLSYSLFRKLDDEFLYDDGVKSNTTITDTVNIKLYDANRQVVAPKITVSFPLSGPIGKYIVINKERYYYGALTDENQRLTNQDIITQPYYIRTNGTIEFDLSQTQRINSLHKYIEVKSRNKDVNSTSANDVRYFDFRLLVNSTSADDLYVFYEFNQPNYTNQTNNYWWDKVNIFLVTVNYNRAMWILFIIMFAIYVVSVLVFMILFHNGNRKVKHYSEEIPNTVGPEEDKQAAEIVSTVGFYQSFNNLSLCECFCLNLKNGLLSPFIREEKVQSPIYKELIHQWFFLFFAMFIFTLLFNFALDLNTTKGVTENPGTYAWFIAVVIGATNIMNFLIYIFYSATEEVKNINYDDGRSIETYSSVKNKNLVKSIVLLLLTFALFGFIFYGMGGFCMAFKFYDHVFLVCYILAIAVDFILFELFISLLVGISGSNTTNNSGCLFKALTGFTKIRNGA